MLFTLENRGIHNPSLFEGDMILTPEQRGNIEIGRDVGASNRQTGSTSWWELLWPYGVVVYDIQPSLGKFLISVKLYLISQPVSPSMTFRTHKDSTVVALSCESLTLVLT